MVKRNDKFSFRKGTETIEYSVWGDFCNSVGDNGRIFKELGLHPQLFCKEHYGYPSLGGDWPCFKEGDYGALQRCLNALANEALDQGWTVTTHGFDINLKKSTKSSPKTLMESLNILAKKWLDADTRKLIKAGLVDNTLDVTGRGREVLQQILLDKFKKELLEVAEEIIAEEEKK